MSAGVLTVDELAARWKCSRGNIYDMVKTGDLPSIKRGRFIRISLAVVEGVEKCGLQDTGGNGRSQLKGEDFQPESQKPNLVLLENGRPAKKLQSLSGNPLANPAGQS